MDKQKIYLACPYSDPLEAVRARRAATVTTYANELMVAGKIVYSPITHGHAIAQAGPLDGSWEFWRHHCLSFLESWADELWVLQLQGWRNSVGVQAEMAFAADNGITLRLVEIR